MACAMTKSELREQRLSQIVHSFKCLNKQLSGQTITDCPEVLCPKVIAIISHCIGCDGTEDNCLTSSPLVCRSFVWLIEHWNSCTNGWCSLCPPVRTDILLEVIDNYVKQQLSSKLTTSSDQLSKQSLISEYIRKYRLEMIVQSMNSNLIRQTHLKTIKNDDKVMNQLMNASEVLERQAFEISNTHEEYANFLAKYMDDIQDLLSKTLEEYSMNELLSFKSDNCFDKDMPEKSDIDTMVNWFDQMNI